MRMPPAEEAAWPSGKIAGPLIRRTGVQVPPWAELLKAWLALTIG